MKKVLITGGCGFIGYALTKKMIELGYMVHCLDNLSIGEIKNPHSLGAKLIVDDIRNINNLPIEKYDYIFHLAALSRIQPSFKAPTETFSVNADGTRAVVEYAEKNGSKLIYAGSSSRHHDPLLSPYATSKYIGEQWVKLYRKNYNLNAEIARFYNVYGEGELIDSKMAAVIGIWRKKIMEGEPLPIVGTGEQRRDFTHIDDIVDGLILIAESNEKNEDAWELGTGKNFSLNQVYGFFNKRFGCGKITLEQQNGNYAETIRINDDALIRLGWKPKGDLEKYIMNL